MSGQTRSIPTTSIARPTTRRRELEAYGVTWIDLPAPVNADVAFLREQLRLDQLALDDVLSTIQRPKLDVHKGYLFLILQVPMLNRDQRITVNRVAMFVGQSFVVTIHDGNLKTLRRLFTTAASDESARKQLMSRGTGYLLYRAVDALIKHTFPITYQIEEELERLESRAFSLSPARLLRQQAQIERDILALDHILAPNLPVCDALRAVDKNFFQHDFEFFFGDNADGMYKLHDIAAEQRNIAANIGKLVATLSIQQQGNAQRTIAIALLVVAPFTLLAAVAALALAAAPTAQPLLFGVALVVALAIAGALVGFGWTRRWF